MTDPSTPELLRARAAAERLGKHPRTLARWSEQGILPEPIRLGPRGDRHHFARVEESKQATLAEAEEKKVANARERILGMLKAGPMTHREIQQRFNSRTRRAAMNALNGLVEGGHVAHAGDMFLLAE